MRVHFAAVHDSENGTFRTSRDVRPESGTRTKADNRPPLRIYRFHALASLETSDHFQLSVRTARHALDRTGSINN
jgi:hypothetical protein